LKNSFSLFGGGGDDEITYFLFARDTFGAILVVVSRGEPVSGGRTILSVGIPVFVVYSLVHDFILDNFICVTDS
jgi:hypothetical protein